MKQTRTTTCHPQARDCAQNRFLPEIRRRRRVQAPDWIEMNLGHGASAWCATDQDNNSPHAEDAAPGRDRVTNRSDRVNALVVPSRIKEFQQLAR